ncbi:MAG: DUF2244 domain-containing protein [Alphaproteobacteria bacterium]|nr:DUF2244 domain-containing protein [Alphaproteobacteria bacterium]
MSTESTPKTYAETVYFDVELRPHRSLGPVGFTIVMAVATAFGITIGVAFMLVGAWPVFGFCGLEILLLYAAFRLNYRSGQRYERIRLTSNSLQVRRYGPKGETGRWDIEPNWLRIEVDEPARRNGRLTLSSHGRSVTVGGFLPPKERVEVADALRDAIERYRIAAPAR